MVLLKGRSPSWFVFTSLDASPLSRCEVFIFAANDVSFSYTREKPARHHRGLPFLCYLCIFNNPSSSMTDLFTAELLASQAYSEKP